jgi:hypothetical protein
MRLRSRVLTVLLGVAAALLASSCGRERSRPDTSGARLSDTTLAPTLPPLEAATPDPHGLVASILTPLAAKAATTRGPFDGVPLVPSRTPSGRVEWAGDFADGYRDAVERKKAMVVLFGSPGGEWYEKVVASFASPEIAALADQAVWIRSDPMKEVMGKNVCTALGIERVPAISVLDPDPEMISEEARIEGYEEPAKLARDLDVPLKRANGQLPRVPTRKP